MPDTHDSLALSLISAVQCDHAEIATEVVDRYCAYREARGECADRDGVRALLRTFEEVGGIVQWEGKVARFRRRHSPELARIAAAEIEHAAELFYRHRVDSVLDLQAALENTIERNELAAALNTICDCDHAWADLLRIAGVRAPALVG